MKPMSPWQFSIFRIVFGTYLLVHFIHLIPWASELFGKDGIIPDPSQNPTYGLFPNPLYLPLTDGWLTTFLIIMALCSALFAAGIWRHAAAAILWFGWTALFHRNNLISNPSIPYTGLLLILSLLIPNGEPLSRGKHKRPWAMPSGVFIAAWILLAAGYTFSGYTKLFSPSWIDGSAMHFLLENPLARPGFIRDLMIALPDPVLSLMTWGTLAVELLFLPLALWGKSRPWIWLTLVLMHLGIIAVIDFADLSLGMLMIHLFTFDPTWLKPNSKDPLIVHFDSECLMCSKSIRFLAEEDQAELLRFTPLPIDPLNSPSSIQVVTNGKTFTESRAILALLSALGGHWRALSIFGKMMSTPLADKLYRLIARHRYLMVWKKLLLPSPTRIPHQTPLMKRKLLRRTLVISTTLFTINSITSCTSTSPHKGRIPFSWIENPPKATSGNSLATMDLVMKHEAADGPLTETERQALRPGDVIAFHMSHREAWKHLRKGSIQKLPYELFRYGHIALVVPNTQHSNQEHRLLQVAIQQAVNVDSDLDYLSEKSWHVFRPPPGSINTEKLEEFTHQVITTASNPKSAYDYSGILGLRNAPSNPNSILEIGHEFSCATLVLAALHYSGYKLQAIHRNGLADIVTPSQVIHSGALQ